MVNKKQILNSVAYNHHLCQYTSQMSLHLYSKALYDLKAMFCQFTYRYELALEIGLKIGG